MKVTEKSIKFKEGTTIKGLAEYQEAMAKQLLGDFIKKGEELDLVKVTFGFITEREELVEFSMKSDWEIEQEAKEKRKEKEIEE